MDFIGNNLHRPVSEIGSRASLGTRDHTTPALGRISLWPPRGCDDDCDVFSDCNLGNGPRARRIRRLQRQRCVAVLAGLRGGLGNHDFVAGRDHFGAKARRP